MWTIKLNVLQVYWRSSIFSVDDPYSVVIVESKLQNDVDKSTKGELHLNTSLDDILDICDQI